MIADKVANVPADVPADVPEFISHHPENVTVSVGGTVSVLCHIRSTTQPLIQVGMLNLSLPQSQLMRQYLSCVTFMAKLQPHIQICMLTLSLPQSQLMLQYLSRATYVAQPSNSLRFAC